MQKVLVLGAGNYGFGLTCHLDRKQDENMDLWLYDRHEENAAHIRETGQHPRFFPLASLSKKTHVTSDLQEAVSGADVIILAVVSTAVRDVLAQLKPLLTEPVALVSVMKALDQQTASPLTTVLEQEMAGLPVTLAVMAGGTTGEALTSEQYLGATLACSNEQVRAQLAAVFESPYLRIQQTADMIGVQYAGSLKNLVSVVVGLIRGLGFAYGTQTHALSLIATECESLAVSKGADRETFDFDSQCWGNDMVMSSTDSKTRNHQLGLLLGQGYKFSQAVEEMKANGKTAEAANTLPILDRVADLNAYPLLHFLWQLSREEVETHEVIKIIETS
ncbi:NAD(P)-binding domain-containing protein [bacterium]|nr:NAD(P)-binding domain-containing protein [bacterium]